MFIPRKKNLLLNKICFVKVLKNVYRFVTLIISFSYCFLFLGTWFVTIIIPIYSHISDNMPTPEVSMHCILKNILQKLCQK